MPRNSKIVCEKKGKCCVISTAGPRKGQTLRCFTRKRGKKKGKASSAKPLLQWPPVGEET